MSTLFSAAAPAESSWQATYRARLEQRQTADNVHAEIIQACESGEPYHISFPVISRVDFDQRTNLCMCGMIR